MKPIDLYYSLKPIIPRKTQIYFRRVLAAHKRERTKDIWPINHKAVSQPEGWKGWPNNKRFAFILQHDVETEKGLKNCARLMDIEKRMGFRSAFYFVPEDYVTPRELLRTIKDSGFEVGVHGLRHDGKTFRDSHWFYKRAPKINYYLREWNAVGFTSPSMLRNLRLMAELDIEHGCSTFDTDPFEPQSEGVGTIFPLFISNASGKRTYVELPYTLPQDHCLFIILKEKNGKIWEEKLEWIAQNGGMALMKFHPDYMNFDGAKCSREEYPVGLYLDFLEHIKTKYCGQYWHVLPREMARFWRNSVHQARSHRSVLIIIENQTYPFDPRVRSEATSLRDAGWNVHVVCPEEDQNLERSHSNHRYPKKEIDGINVHYYNVKLAMSGTYAFFREYLVSIYHIFRLTWPLWRRSKFDLIHLCNPPDFLFIIGMFYRIMGARIVFDQHDLFPEMILTRYKGVVRCLFFYLGRFVERLTFRTADVVISTNQSYQDIAIDRGRMSKDRVYVVRNGPVLSKFVPEEPEPELKQGFAFMICYAGSMGEEDGVIELISTIHHIIYHLGRKDILFNLMGDGSVRTRALRLISALGLKEYVKMPGAIRDDKLLRRYLSSADLLLAPELSNPLNDKSTFIKVAEYMAMGKPIVAYDLKETHYTAGDSALYVQSGNIQAYAQAIIDLLNDPDRRARMGAYGRERVVRLFGWEAQFKNLLSAYEKAFE